MAVDHSLPLLSSLVHVRQNSSRSVNLEQDLERATVADGYLLTPQARRSLHQIIQGADALRQHRAWTLTGPYGSGKSYFGVFLMNLLSRRLLGHESATERLQTIDASLAAEVQRAARLSHSSGLLPVAITGFRAPLQQCIAQGLRHTLEPLRADPVIHELLQNSALWMVEGSGHTLVHILRTALDLMAQGRTGYSGIVLVLDEMGKPLEHAAAHPESADLYLLQEIAELANRSHGAPLLFVGILHQSFDRYAGHLESVAQREWDKIQGRFQDIAFQEPPNQQIRLIAQALEPLDGDALAALEPEIVQQAQNAVDIGWCPPTIPPDDFIALCRQSYPLHPTALAALPYLFRRLAQNERSLFVYLTSHEPKGFQEFLAVNTCGAFVRLPDLFDYLVANFQARLFASLRARPLTEAIERLHGAVQLDPVAVDLIKTIGLLNWLADMGPFQATEASILIALRSPALPEKTIRRALEQLFKQSHIVFRRYNQSYVIWQGSDVDIEERTQEARHRLISQFSVADAVQAYQPAQPIVARRHSYETGTVRYFAVRYVDSLTRDRIELTIPPGASGLVMLCLSASGADVDDFEAWARNSRFADHPGVVVGVAQRTARLADLLTELRALHWVRENTPELRDDPVARRELRARLGDLETLVRNELEQSLRMQGTASGACRWFAGGQEVTHEATRSLSHLLSTVADHLYPASPQIRNEILNRRALSSQGAAARRNLIERIAKCSQMPCLGIEGFPPERSMYESLLLAGGLHRQDEAGTWNLVAPPADDPLHLQPAWNAIAAYIFATPPAARPVQVLFAQLGEAPYGITQGVLPVLLCTFVLVHGDETTLYREGSLLVEPGIADWEMLLRRPELFAVAGCRVTGELAAVVQRLAYGLRTAPAALPVVRELVRRLKGLPEYAWRTQRLAPQTIDVRRAVDQARSPENLLFYELPMALDVPLFDGEAIAEEAIELFFQRLNRALEELSQSTPTVIAYARDHLLAACALPAGEAGWEEFAALAGAMAAHVTQPTLLPLLRRAADPGPAQSVLESTLAYVASRPPRSWSDGDVDRFQAQARVLGGYFKAERNGHQPEAALTDAQKVRSTRIAAEMRIQLNEDWHDDPLAVQAALQTLLSDMRAATQMHPAGASTNGSTDKG